MSSLSRRLRRALVVLVSAVLLVAALASVAAAQGSETPEVPSGDGQVIDILPVEGYLDPPVADQILDVVREANELGHELVVIQIDHAGAVSVDVDELADAIQASEVPVVVYVGPLTARAHAQGAALVLLGAAHVRAAAPDATLGPLSPVEVGGGDGDVAGAADRLQAMWPALAETPGWDLLAGGGDAGSDGRGAAVEDVEGALDLVVNGLEPLLTELDGATVTTAAGEVALRIRRDEVDNVRFHTLGLVRRMLHAATTPVFIYLLLVVGLALLLFEVFQPGFGVAGIAGVVTLAIGAFGLTVLPVHPWAVALVVLGLLLFAVDTALAGFGAMTAAAAATFGVGSWFFYDSPVIGLPGWLVVLTTVAAGVFFVFVLTTVLRAQAGPEDAALEDLVGRVGIVRSMLNPEGHVYIDDALWRARWIGEARRAKVGTPIRVEAVEGATVLVDAFDPEAARTAPGARGEGA